MPGLYWSVIVDDLSRARQMLSTEWPLHQDIVSLVFNLWVTPIFTISDQVQSQMPNPCVADPRQQGSRHIHPSNGLGGNIGLCIPSPTDSDTDSQQSQQDKVLHSDSCSPDLAKTVVVSGPTKPLV